MPVCSILYYNPNVLLSQQKKEQLTPEPSQYVFAGLLAKTQQSATVDSGSAPQRSYLSNNVSNYSSSGGPQHTHSISSASSYSGSPFGTQYVNSSVPS